MTPALNTIPSRADFIGDPSHAGRVHNDPATGQLYFFTRAARAQFRIPEPGQLGNASRNQFIGPSYYELNASLSKVTRLVEPNGCGLAVGAARGRGEILAERCKVLEWIVRNERGARRGAYLLSVLDPPKRFGYLKAGACILTGL